MNDKVKMREIGDAKNKVFNSYAFISNDNDDILTSQKQLKIYIEVQ